MSPRQAWKILGIAPTTDVGAVRKAYADKLKASDPDADPAAYAALRDARDMALGYARSPAARAALAPVESEAGEVPPPEPAAPPPPRPPSIPTIETDAPAISVPAPQPGTPMRPLAPDFARDEAPESAPLPADPWARPTLAPDAPLPAGMVKHGPRADQRLWSLLHVNGNDDTTPLEPGELDAAREALREVLDDAARGDLALHGVIDNWLASTLAGSWPRCAPLLEQSAEAFNWEQQAGKLGEPPAVAFLNARLKGLRFQDKVLDPGHPLHRAWQELRREGRANFIDRLRTSKQDVRTLLDGLRKNFPELEDHLNPQRVASWEQDAGGVGGSGFSWRLLWFGVIILIQIARFASSGGSGNSESRHPPLISPTEAVASADYRPRIDDVVHEVFGKEASADWLLQRQPVLMAEITREIGEDGGPQGDNTALKGRMVERVRERLYENGRIDKGDNFELAMRTHLAQLKEAQSMGAPACATFRQTDDFGSVEISVTLREQERAAARKFAETGNLASAAPREAAKAMVPGLLVEKVMANTGLAHERVAAAMQGKGSPEETCAVNVALLEATLGWKGKERTAILKTL